MTSRARLILTAGAICVIALGLLPGRFGDRPAPDERLSAPLQRSDAVIEAKIARKQAKMEGGHDSPEHPDEYADYRRMVRPHPEGTRIPQLLMEAKRHVEAMSPVQGDRDAGLWDWEWLGPGNIGGRVRAILTHPDEPNTLWAGSVGGGIWKTTNGGSSWFPLSDLLPSLAITALVMDPNDPDRIYAATGEGYAGDGIPGAGILTSADGGDSWSQLESTDDPAAWYVNDLAHHPVTSGRLLACVARSGRFTGDGEVWLSVDYGVSWTSTLTTPEPAYDIAIDPDSPAVVIMSYKHGCWRSGNGGVTWVELSIGGAGNLPDDTGRVALSFGVGNDMVYASCNTPRDGDVVQGEIWRSSDNGLTWELRNDIHHVLGRQGDYDNVIWLEPGSTDRIIVGGINLYKSFDGGTNLFVISDWTNYHNGGNTAHSDQHAIVPHIDYGNGSNTIYFGNDGGVQRNSTGFGAGPYYGWVNLANNLGITQFYHADASPNGDIILGGSQDNDDLLFTRTSGAQAWYQAETGDGTYCAINPLHPDTLFGCYPFLEIERSTNGGASYYDSFNGLGDAGIPGRAMFMSPFAIDKTAPYQLMAGGRSLWRSYNDGTSWHEVLSPRVGDPLCSAIEISPTQGNVVVWAGYANGEIWVTDDHTLTWSQLESVGGNMPDGYITDIEISPHDPDVVLVAIGGYDSNRIQLTTDGGQSWTALNGTGDNSIPPVQVSCITFHPIDSDWIYAGTDIGLFASEDMGQNWSVTSRHGENEGPAYTEIADLIWHSYSTLVAVTHGRGMFECLPLANVWVDQGNGGDEDGTHLHPWNTFTEGRNAIGNGAALIVKGGDYDEGAAVITKRIQIQGSEGTVVIH